MTIPRFSHVFEMSSGNRIRSEMVESPEGPYVRYDALGFTQEDVTLLRAEWHDTDCGALYAFYDHECDCSTRPAHAALRVLADRIAALLPPPPPMETP